MNIDNIHAASDWFEVLQTTGLCQTAAMTLAPGKATGEEAEAHKDSEQVLLVVSGEVQGEVGGERVVLRSGDTVVVAAGVKHRFWNAGSEPAVTFNVYVPPEYPPGTKG